MARLWRVGVRWAHWRDGIGEAPAVGALARFALLFGALALSAGIGRGRSAHWRGVLRVGLRWRRPIGAHWRVGIGRRHWGTACIGADNRTGVRNPIP